MSILRHNKQWAGNVCLIVFAALLFSMVSGTIGVGVAQAALNDANASITVTDDTHPGYSAGTIYSNDSQTQYDTKILLYPVSPSEFSAIGWMQLTGSQVSQTVYMNNVSKATYVGNSVYELIYSFVYSTGFSPGTYSLAFYANNGLPLKSVSLELKGPPPKSSSSSGGGGTTTTTSGEIIQPNTTTSGNIASATVDTSQVTSQIQQNTKAENVAIKVPVQANVSEVKVALPPAAVTAIIEAKKNLKVETQVATVVLPPAVLAVPEIKDQLASGAKLELSTKQVEKQQETTVLQQKDKVAVPASAVVELNLNLVSQSGQAQKVTSFKSRVFVDLPYDPAKLGNVPASKLGVYRYNEATKSWDYKGGKVNLANNKITVGLESFSLYTVMAYDKTFADIASHWARSDIELLAARHVAQGVSDSSFEPERDITRAEFAALLLRSLSINAVKPQRATFNDIGADKWYYGAVETARREGLVMGFEDNSFRPEQKIDRQEMAAMVTRALKYAGQEVQVSEAEVSQLLAAFQDNQGISAWARSAAAAAVKSGIVKGRTASSFAPATKATRAESATMLKRMLGSLGEV